MDITLSYTYTRAQHTARAHTKQNTRNTSHRTRTILATSAINGAGGHTSTSHARALSPSIPAAAPTSAANVAASLAVFGFIFQFPAMIARLVVVGFTAPPSRTSVNAIARSNRATVVASAAAGATCLDPLGERNASRRPARMRGVWDDAHRRAHRAGANARVGDANIVVDEWRRGDVSAFP